MLTQSAPTAFSGTIPANYDRYLGPLFFEPFAEDLAQRVKRLQPQNVLELACGTGRVTAKLPAMLPSGARLIATDVNPAMLAQAKELLKDNPQITWAVVNAEELPYEDAQFDLVLVQYGVMFYDRSKGFKEAHRVLRPGGTFLFNAWDDLAHNPFAQLTQDVVAERFPIDTPAFYELPFSYHNEASIREDLANAGFGDVQIELLSRTGYSESPEAAATGLLEGSPIYTAITDRDASALPQMKQELSRKLQAQFGAKDLQVPLSARVVTAVKA